MLVAEVSLDEVKIKVEKLINHHKELVKKCRTLEHTNYELSQKLQDGRNKVTELQSQNKIIKLGQAINGNGADQNSRDLKLKINEYIREIDKCLALLHK